MWLHPQYQQLQELYEAFKDKLTVVGFTSNDFGAQEAGTNAEIKAFCTLKYGIKFPIAAKTSISEPDCHPINKWLGSKEKNGKLDSTVEWNFNKYLLGEDGHGGFLPFLDRSF